jgi:hypothetical protein
MSQILNQFRRIISDDGRNDKDFTKQEEKLREAREHLHKATDALKKSARNLTDYLITSHHHNG